MHSISFIGCCVLLVSGLLAAENGEISSDISKRPSDAIFVEAEQMSTDGKTWSVQEHQSGAYFGYPSGLKFLAGNTGGQGTATRQVTIPQDGRYRLWVRYIDIYPNKPTDPRYPFNLRLLQNSRPAIEKAFDITWLRATPEAQKKWDTWARLFVWDFVEVDLKAGPCVIEMSKLEPMDTGYWRWVDCFVLTANIKYEPNSLDFVNPIYLKIMMNKMGNPAPVLFNIWGGCGHVTVSKNGIRLGHMAFPLEARMAAGDESPWVNIAGTLPSATGVNRFRLDALTDWYVPTKESDFTVLLSKTPAKNGIIGQFERKGTGGGIRILLDPTKLDQTTDALKSSQTILAAVEAMPPAKGRRPTQFPLITGLYHEPSYTPPNVIANDLQTLELLGFSGTANCLINREQLRQHGLTFNSSQCTTYWALKDHCLHQPDWEAIRKAQADNLKNYCEGEVQWIKLMDEIYSVTLDHLKSCPICAGQFGQYLESLGLPRAAPVVDRSGDPKLFYHTMRFRSQTQADFLKGCTKIVRELRPDVQTIANATTELTFSGSKNLLVRGTDWFELYKQQALTFGFAQDANACTPSQQTISYMMDVLRSACKYRDQPYGLYNMISRSAWDIGAKSFAEVGHGARMIDFYNWGPHYADGCDEQSQRPELYPVLRDFNFAVGAVEGELLKVKPVQSKIALLYSHTSDIWDLTPQDWGCDKQIFGGELMYLHLLLSHLGYPIDILTEDDVLDGRTAGYEAVFVAGSHLKDGVLPRLLTWTQEGGLLCLSAGAAERNQFNEPTRDLDEIGLKRHPFVYHEPPGHEESMPGMQVIAQVNADGQKFDVVGGLQKLASDTKGRVLLRFDDADASPCAAEIVHGQGRVVFFGFFPAMTYVRDGCIVSKAERQRLRSEDKPLVTWNPPSYPEAPRRLFAQVLDSLKFEPPVRVSHYLVEGCLSNGSDGAVLALANWSGKPQNIDVTVRVPGVNPRAAIGTLTNVRREGDALRFSIAVERGDFVVIPSK